MKQFGLGLFILMFFSCSQGYPGLNDNDSLIIPKELDSINIIQLTKIDSVSKWISFQRERPIINQLTEESTPEKYINKLERDDFYGVGFLFGEGLGSNNSGIGDGFAKGLGDGVTGNDSGEDSGIGSSGDLDMTNLQRKVIDYGSIDNKSEEEGEVAINIWVNDKGGVVKVKFNPAKSNTDSAYLISLAKKWAHTMKYEKLLGAPIQYVGFKIFNFKRQ